MKSNNSVSIKSSTFQINPILTAVKKALKRGSHFGTSFILSSISIVPFASASPLGGNITGGAGNISQSGLTTTINQNTSSLSIDWNSFNVNSNEVVNFIQPSSSSIALNRILGNSGSQIMNTVPGIHPKGRAEHIQILSGKICHGQINANEQVELVNPNGIFFGSSSTVNVGDLIASGLDISTTDFMNGNYLFIEVLGTDDTVINQGLIYASVGGVLSVSATLNEIVNV